jgi:hypothetical protein
MYLSDNKSSQQASFIGPASLTSLSHLPSTSDANIADRSHGPIFGLFPQAFKALTTFNSFNHFFKIKAFRWR